MTAMRTSEVGVMICCRARWKDSDLCSAYSLIDSRPEHQLSELGLSVVFLHLWSNSWIMSSVRSRPLSLQNIKLDPQIPDAAVS
jgi:hypothetical protein